MLTIVQTDEENFNNGFSEFINAIVVVFITQDDRRERLYSCSFFDKVIWLNVFFFEKVDDFLDLIVIFFIGIAPDNYLKLFTGTLSFLFISDFKE